MSDPILWNNFRSGDAQALSSIYHAYVRDLYHYGSKLTADKKLVEDTIQDLFIELWNKRSNLGDTTSIKFYLLKCLRRKLVKMISFVDAVEINDDYHFEFVDSVEAEIIARQTKEYQLKELYDCLKFLTRRQREAIYLKYYQELSIEEISMMMSLSLKGTYNLLSKSIIAMREHIAQSGIKRIHRAS
jgi:RNA polymerase sigma factor (sigma-70 family)